ncbi:hypothetical protein WMF38_13560 [Sorangium sp. So ce118]
MARSTPGGRTVDWLDLPPGALNDGDSLGYREKSRRNIENFVGTLKIPVGVTKPILIHFDYGAYGPSPAEPESVVVPLATTEGTLVASTSRGAKMLNASGGVRVSLVARRHIQRTPAFQFATPGHANRFALWIEASTAASNAAHPGRWWNSLCGLAEKRSAHAKLMNVQAIQQGRYVHVRMSMDCDEAAGHNMVSIGSAALAEGLAERWNAELGPGEQDGRVLRLWMDGGLSGEKAAIGVNRALGRGRSVVASAALPGAVLKEMGRVNDPRDFVEYWQIRMNSYLAFGGQASSSSGPANDLAAIFAATGQDLACHVECSIGHTYVRYDERTDVLHWDLSMPCLLVGVVGGGTGLPAQREALQIMGCAPDPSAPRGRQSDRLAMIIGAAALANEISFHSAMHANEWVAAHAALKTSRG